MEILVGIAAIVLGILSLIFVKSGVLVLVGFLAVGAALLDRQRDFSRHRDAPVHGDRLM
jgi:hypothetical protein